MTTIKRKKKVDPSKAPSVEVYNHVDDEVRYIKSNELTMPEQIFAWVVVSLLLIMLFYTFF